MRPGDGARPVVRHLHRIFLALEERAQPRVGEDPLDEILAEPGIPQPAFLLDRQMREAGDECLGEQTAPALLGRPGPGVNPDAFHPTAR